MDSVNPTPPPRSLASTFGVKVYRYRALLRRYWWILALTVSIGVAFESWRVFSKKDLFESKSELRLREELANEGKFREIDSVYGDTIKMLASSEIADAARAKVEVEHPSLRGDVTVTATVAPKTSIFTVVGAGTNPEHTRRYVDAVVSEFINFRKKERTLLLSERNSEVSEELQRVRKDLARQRAEFSAFVERNDMGFWEKTSETSVKYLIDLQTQQAQLADELKRLEVLSPEQLLTSPDAGPQLQTRIGSGAGSTSPHNSNANSAQRDVMFSTDLRNQYWTASQQLTQKRDQVAERSTVWKAKHPKLQALKAELQLLERQIETLKNNAGEMRAGNIEGIRTKLASLELSIPEWTAKVQEATRMNEEYKRLAGAVKRTEEQEDQLIKSLGFGSNTGINSGLPSVIQKATVATPVPKGVVKHLLLGLLGGAAFGGLILFLLNRSDDRVSSSSEVIEHFSEPILAQIPNVIESRKDFGLPLLQADDERYTYAEAFRSLRSSLIFMPNQAELKTLLITSAIPNEGKSTVASNLAVTMAASGARVILIDADLRRGDLAALFDTDGRLGLSTLLREEVPWREVVQPTAYPTLSLIPRGPVTNQSGELLLKPVLTRFLSELKEVYDLVVFNTAPILATDDTPTLAPHFDGTLMIVRAQFTSARLTENALSALYQRQVNVLGLILNCVDTEMPDYYYYRYPKYYAA